MFQPSGNVVHDGLRIADLGITSPSAGFKPGVSQLPDQRLQGHAMLECNREHQGKRVHEAGDGRAFLGHGNEYLAGLAVLVESDRQVTLMSRDGELVGHGRPSIRQTMAHGARRCIRIIQSRFSSSLGIELVQNVLNCLGLLVFLAGHQHLVGLRAIAVDCNSLQTQLPGLYVSILDLLDGCRGRHVHGLRDCAGKKRLRGCHHLDVAHVLNESFALGRLESRVEDSQVFSLQRRSFQAPELVDVDDEVVDLLRVVAKLFQCLGNGLVDDLELSTADQLLVLDQSQLRFNACGIAVHEEPDGAGGRQDRDLGIAVAVNEALIVGSLPVGHRCTEQIVRNGAAIDMIQGLVVHPDHVQEGLLVAEPTGASPCVSGPQACSRLQRRQILSQESRGGIGPSCHDRGDRRGIAAAFIGVIGQAEGHQKRAKIGISQPQRPVVMRVLCDALSRIPRQIDQNVLRDREQSHRLLECLDIENAVPEELQQIQRSQIAGRIVQKEVFGAGIRGVDAAALLAGMPLVDGVIELHSRIATLPCGPGDSVHQVARAVVFDLFSGFDGQCAEVEVIFDRVHELIAHAHRVVGILIEHRSVRRTVRPARSVIAFAHQRLGLLVLQQLALDEVHDVGMLDVQDGHLGRTPRLAA